jgi:hypothetical protein
VKRARIAAGKRKAKQVQNVLDPENEVEEETADNAADVGNDEDKENGDGGGEEQQSDGDISSEIEGGCERNNEKGTGSQHPVSDRLNRF